VPLKIDFQNPGVKKVRLTIIFYLIALLLFFLLEEIEPTGPCTPGLGIIGLIFLPYLSLVLFVINFIMVFRGKIENKYSAIIHLVVGLSLIILFRNFI
jgi:hypothetical protein